MEDIKYEGLMGILSEIKKDTGVIRADNKVKENQQVNQAISKEEAEKLFISKTAAIVKYIELRFKEQMETQTKLLTDALRVIDNKVSYLLKDENVSLEPIMKLLSQPKKVTICGFEFLRSSVIIFILLVTAFLSLTVNIKQMDDYQALKAKLYQQTEYILHLEEAKEEQMKSRKGK